ncbi:hypothetical protein HYU15_04130 [Candidatus Woesearchaeota archaeon]|nr:hypothetical protein [Candidatus Woesearchaeota archaeon]
MAAYTYLLGSTMLLALWIGLFIHRKDVRKEMLFVSLIVAFFGLALEGLALTKDWWQPETITGTIIGIEDFIYGFAIAGIAAVIYEEIFKRKLHERKKGKHDNKDIAISLALMLVTFSISFFALKIHSFYSTVLALSFGAAYILAKRPDLTIDSIATGTILTIIGLLGYLIVNAFSPGFVNDWFFMDKLSGILILGYPIEDLIWYFLTGMLLGPIYEAWQNARLVKKK